MKVHDVAAWLVAVPLLILGCQQAERPSEDQYDVTGKVTAVDADKQTVTLDHEDIPGLMSAMEMEFKVESLSVLEGISTGDQVQGRLRAKSGDYTITHLEER